MVRQVQNANQLASLQKSGYKREVVKSPEGRTVKILLTKEYKGFWSKTGLFFTALFKTIFTFHVSAKTKDQWSALNSGKISLEVPQNLWGAAKKVEKNAKKVLSAKGLAQQPKEKGGTTEGRGKESSPPSKKIGARERQAYSFLGRSREAVGNKQRQESQSATEDGWTMTDGWNENDGKYYVNGQVAQPPPGLRPPRYIRERLEARRRAGHAEALQEGGNVGAQHNRGNLPPPPEESKNVHDNVAEENRLKGKGIKVADSYPQFAQIDRKNRMWVKNDTLRRMSKLFGFDVTKKTDEALLAVPDQDLATFMKEVQYLKVQGSTQRSTNILGRYDVIATPCVMEYDRNFNDRGEPNHALTHHIFYAVHASAPNIGESTKAEDFDFYSKGGKLDKKKYLTDFGKIADNTLFLQNKMGVKDTVWVPFGMGAFHAHLNKKDSTFSDRSQLQDLKKDCANTILSQLKKYPDMTLHLCLPDDSRAKANYDAFVSALESMPQDLKDRVKIYINGDATQVAQNLANEKGDYQVGLVNGANRNMIGHAWWGDMAEYAIDENLHRRSLMTALISYLLNRGMTPTNPLQYRDKQPDELEKTVKHYCGDQAVLVL